ncbi:MAG: 2-amino-4-hydroxy-6-hydroxymethyldihydropteridine diphosphokinase [Dehalococcoidia bacterium]
MGQGAPVTVYLGLGSNVGDRQGNLRQAVRLLQRCGQVEALSSLYETEPWGYTQQPKFLNLVCQLSTSLEPLSLLHCLKEVERAVGRRPTFRYGPRELDIDILLYGELVLEMEELAIPHPGLPERPFVLVPLVELAPELEHPLLKVTMARLAEAVQGKEGIRWWALPGALQKP